MIRMVSVLALVAVGSLSAACGSIAKDRAAPSASPMPVAGWPTGPRNPAITRTIRPAAPAQLASPAPPAYDPNWQNQTVPSPQPTPRRQFSIPQQGYYPREGEIPQAPGYEYDFGGPATFPPTVPMEGAALPESTTTLAGRKKFT